ncbi:hypothetical protein NBH19_13320 [Rhizobium sp. S95]|uniref:Uncharacterized protein n=1 Tax=Ciceribacter sichuanensis TaxID=2949647 RepID=A0AAJ1BX67_9HYPH|nr:MULTISPECIES: hypothetical protein [unclassified Ciceribacter]MCM2397052.1 hypothetical protein [Ciceribacter sp. S95]MCM2401440.1 hypothetical protein [Ciceribacter sp. S153]MCO5957856.1 hypothetical protein [Ciceribacter sp. S101]
MASEARLPLLLAFLGSVVTALALGWWWLIFGKVVEGGYITYAQAAPCLAGTSDLCRLAEALCTNDHFFGVRWYAPEALWVGAALLAAALLNLTVRTGVRSTDQSR